MQLVATDLEEALVVIIKLNKKVMGRNWMRLRFMAS